MELRDYMEKNIIGWLFYKENYDDFYSIFNKKICYVYPRIIIKGNTYEIINPTDFPKHGRIEVRIQGDDSAEELYSRVGSLVSIRINRDTSYYPENNNVYCLKYNRQFEKTNSEIWIEPFSGKGYYQVVDLETDFTDVQKNHLIPAPDYTIHTTLIMLRCGENLYGPFEYDIKESTMALRGLKDFQYSVGKYSSVYYNDNLLIITDQNDTERVLLLPKYVIPSPENVDNRFDWISEEALVDSFIDTLRIHNEYSRDQVRQLKEMATQLLEIDSDIKLSEERISRIQSLMGLIADKEAAAQTLVQFALSNDTTKDTLVNEIIANHFDQIENRITEFASIQDRLSELKGQEVSLERHIKELQLKEKGAREETSEEDQNLINELSQKNEELRQENAALSEKVGLKEEVEALKVERDNLKKDRDRAKDSYDQQLLDNRDLEKQFSSTLEAFSDRAKATARILDSKLLDKILRGVGEEPMVTSVTPFDTSLLHSTPMDHNEIIERIKSFIINKAHREVSKNDVANYLICISQGFITTFAGEPGTGKTSLCNILAKALGLVLDTPQKRFIDISVERGWASHKDFIGYYNPLTKSLEKSNIEVFNAFEQMNEEYGCDISQIAPFVILLDEANLSPIEHYWAAFLRNCDFSSVSNRTISLGGNQSFKLPEHLRFLATVNFDHTTEELSPRFLDRSWVIMLDPSRINDEVDEEIENYEDVVSFGTLQSAFSVRDDDIIDESIQTKWSAIQKAFREHSLQIMPRNQKMVRNYCTVGCRCMEQDTPTTRLAPLDYAISQKILPTINGNGENYRLLIEDLMKECTQQNMPISAKHLERMKRIAEANMGFYQFFSH